MPCQQDRPYIFLHQAPQSKCARLRSTRDALPEKQNLYYECVPRHENMLIIPVYDKVLYYYILPGFLVILLFLRIFRFFKVKSFKGELRKKLKEYKMLLKIRGGL